MGETCIRCNQNEETSIEGAISRDNCTCVSGFVRVAGICQCPEGHYCCDDNSPLCHMPGALYPVIETDDFYKNYSTEKHEWETRETNGFTLVMKLSSETNEKCPPPDTWDFFIDSDSVTMTVSTELSGGVGGVSQLSRYKKCPQGSQATEMVGGESICICPPGTLRDFGNVNVIMESKTNASGWTLAKELPENGTRWYSEDGMFARISTQSDEQVTVAVHPAWEEILLVRAPDTQLERWMRISRTVWNSIAAVDYLGGHVNISFVDSFPPSPVDHAIAFRRDDRHEDSEISTFWIFAPEEPEERKILRASLYPGEDEHMHSVMYIEDVEAAHKRNHEWFDSKITPKTKYRDKFQVFVRQPTWKDHYLGCMKLDDSRHLPEKLQYGTFYDAIRMCENYEYFTIHCSHEIRCMNYVNTQKLTRDGACSGVTDSEHPSNYDCVAPKYPNVDDSGAPLGGWKRQALYRTHTKEHACKPV